VAAARLGQRIVFAETLGHGLGAADQGRSPARSEVEALAAEIAARLTA
jgi:chromosome partitioning protein